MREWNRTVEVLAPAGSFEIMKAVIHAGADAVYLGGDHFGARAYAGNFNKEELLEAIEYAHLYNRKIYLTVNTLLKERELESRLVEYLTPFYEAGLDAVIVQDMGVFRVVHAHFPDMAIHASTQMAITGKNAAKILQDMGAARVVTARELNLKEIQAIHETTDVEIESFVHGALCYCYSGQCLLSSMNGGRSGNRGRCAQPCRMEYDVSDAQHNKINGAKEGFVLSPKDMCALDILPQIIEAGVYSLKIEGRMKNVTYAAGVTALYRKYVDMYFAKGKKYHVAEQDRLDLMDLYNRGAFTSGYYNSKKGAKMMSVSRPNHMGTQALKVCANHSGKVTFEALEQIHPQDVFEIDRDNSFSSGQTYHVGERFVVNLPKKYQLTEGMILNRTRNGRIVREVEENYVKNICKQQVDAACFLHTAEPMQLILTETERGISVHVEGDIVLEAQKQPIAKEKAEMQLRKTGDTPFVIGNITTEISENAFVPIGQLNELRRSAFAQLRSRIAEEYKKILPESEMHRMTDDTWLEEEVYANKSISEYGHSVTVTTLEQLDTFSSENKPQWIYIEDVLYEQDAMSVQRAVEDFHKMGIQVACVLPYVTTGKHEERLQERILQSVQHDNQEMSVDAFVVRNIEQIGVIAVMHKEQLRIPSKIITDASLYIWNTQALIQLKDFVENQGLTLIRVTLPYEETAREMCMIDKQACGVDVELVVYTRIPVMVSEQCVKRTLGRCDHANGKVVLSDQKKQQYVVQSRCAFCYSVMYHSKSLYLLDMEDEIAEVSPQYLRMDLIEKTDSYAALVQDIITENDRYRGHFVLGVE